VFGAGEGVVGVGEGVVGGDEDELPPQAETAAISEAMTIIRCFMDLP